MPAPLDYASMLGYAPSVPQAAPPQVAIEAPPPLELPEPVEPIAQPDFQAPPAQLAAPLPIQPQQPQAGSSFGGSASGYSPAANQAIVKGPQTGLERSIARDNSRVDQTFRPLAEQLQESTAAAVFAEGIKSQVEAAKAVAVGQGKQKMAKAQADFQAQEQAAMDNARAESQAAIGEYRASLADYAATRPNPAQLWDNNGAFGQFAMIATAFGHDFLGAKGIKTSGMDSIRSAIQHNINAQLENMAKKQNVASGFKQLWEMQRAQSSSDAEARARMQGFYLQSVSNQIEADLSGYDSDLALAKGQAAKAELLKELVKNDLVVQQHIDQSKHQQAAQRIDVYKANLAASTARYSADASLQAQRLAAAAKAKSPLEDLVIDTSKSGKNRADRRFLPGVPDELKGKLRVQNSSIIRTAELIQDLVVMQDAISKVPPTDIGALKKMQGEAERAAEQLRILIRTSLLYDATGKAINEQEMEIFNEIIPKKDWWLNGDNTRALAIAAKTSLDKQRSIMAGLSYKIEPGDPAYGFSTGPSDTAEAEHTLFDIQSQPGAGKPVDKKEETLTKWATSPNATERVDPAKLAPDPEIPGLTAAKISKDWADYKSGLPQAKDEEPTNQNKFIQDAISREKALPDRAFIQIERLAELALKGNTKAKSQLESWAKLPQDGTQSDIDVLLSNYAEWSLGKFKDKKSRFLQDDVSKYDE